MIWIQAALMFVFSMSSDWLVIHWHEARENKEPFRGAYLAFIMGVIGWLSFIWVLNTSIWLAGPDLVGTVLGSYFGIKYRHAPLPIAVALGFSSKPKEDEE